jgi:hybrid cluster-associated redox disulfide protein
MKSLEQLTSTMTVKECLERFPQAVHVFMDAGFLCVGCPTEAFHTLEDVAREYQLDLGKLLRDIRNVIEEKKG